MSSYRIDACEYARRDVTTADYMLQAPDREPGIMSYFVWAIVGPDQTMVVDCGHNAQVGEQMGRPIQRGVAEALGLAGVDCEAVQTLILTHFHFDHAGCIDLFPNARFYAQYREMAFWFGPYASYPFFRFVVQAEDLSRINRLNLDGKLCLIDGSAQIAPGIKLHLAGGHSAGMQIVEVETSQGTAVIASDAIKTYRNLEEDKPDTFLHDVPGVLDGYRLVRSLAGDDGLIFTGHDAKVFERFERHTDHVAVLG